MALEMAPPGGKANMSQFSHLTPGFVHIDSNIDPYIRRLGGVAGTNKMAAILGGSTKFMFVRHPLSRLLSAFRSKLEPGAFDKHNRQRKIAMIRRHFELSHANESVGESVSFEQFLTFVVESRRLRLDNHWARMVDLCNPCLINYDFVGKYETLRDDSAALLRRTGLTQSLDFPTRTASRYGNTSSDDVMLMRRYYKDVPLELGRKVYATYELDFLLFNYSLPEKLFA
ncbi:PREDICTED: carbohydrate sulfotransferase 11-like [Priapulus caudatus]|uniref:Carbohydrate sulfotransferase n=1 Tax=Priapulus caudatus TaxID=37621 RepID=A0ABM1EPI9_PRICU|nr:PREDICTED: carbohydrate sulfotransferase 11-like [Priapulus caudatus]